MRPSNKSRSRNKTGNSGIHNNNQRRNNMGNIINRVFESAGPDGKVRGTPQQIIDKYQALARDAQVAGDRVAAESYLQHSEHYGRLLGEAQRAQQEARASQERESEREEGGFDQRRPQPQPQPQPNVGSGLTMIDTDDGFDAGPIDTPEGRRGYEDGNGFQRRDREQREPRMNGHATHQVAPGPDAAALASQTVPAEPSAPATQAEQPQAELSLGAQSEPAPQAAPAAKPARSRRTSAPAQSPAQSAAQSPAESTAEPQAGTSSETIEMAEPQAEPAKKPRTRRRKTQPAATSGDDAAPAPQPEPAPSE